MLEELFISLFLLFYGRIGGILGVIKGPHPHQAVTHRCGGRVAIVFCVIVGLSGSLSV